jgi:hypothetical protein
MDMSELVMSIVFDNEEAFKNTSKQQIGIICNTTKLAVSNNTIMQLRQKYMALDMYNSVSNKLDEALFTLHNGGGPKTVAKYTALCNEAHDMMADIYDFCYYNADVKECLEMVIMAEYKEATYNIVYSYRDNSYREMYHLYEQVFNNYIDIYNHIHNPYHYVFNGKKYNFYEEVEKHGDSVLEIYDSFFNSDSEDD